MLCVLIPQQERKASRGTGTALFKDLHFALSQVFLCLARARVTPSDRGSILFSERISLNSECSSPCSLLSQAHLCFLRVCFTLAHPICTFILQQELPLPVVTVGSSGLLLLENLFSLCSSRLLSSC